jgi:DNA-binding MltR family transcriptional regulator
MAWITVSSEDKPILDEIEQQTDRAAALIAVAYLEQRLEAAIKARTLRDDKVESKLYRGGGALGSLSVKIDLGLLLGVYTNKMHSFLHTIREIRNEFAHIPSPRDFKSQRIGDLTKNLYVVAKFRMKNKTTGQELSIDIDEAKTPREMFLNAVKLLLICLDMETKQLPLRKPAPPVIRLPPEQPKAT